jgi:hypothetical protein
MDTPSGKSIVPRPFGSRFLAFVLGAALAAVGLLVVSTSRRPGPTLEVPTVVERMRDVARLETLDVNVYKKVGYAPEPMPTGHFWADVLVWAKSALAPSHGRAIVFGTVRVGLDLSRLDASALAIHGNQVEVVLPPLVTRAEVHPAETEVIQSNLDSAQTGQLLELARVAFEQDAQADVGLQARARTSAERALRGLLLSLGFQDVRFVSSLGATRGAG